LNCPILLDEATAALDTESEQLVQRSLETFRECKTVIIVAHRLATVKHANRIIDMQNERVAETGTHNKLLSRNGIYADLIKFQLQFIQRLQNGRSVGFFQDSNDGGNSE
jgi:ABC-type multidrug transport system fused ATPase/permease subunit